MALTMWERDLVLCSPLYSCKARIKREPENDKIYSVYVPELVKKNAYIDVLTEENMTFLLSTASGETEVFLEISQGPKVLQLRVSKDNCGAVLVGKNVPLKVEVNLHMFNKEQPSQVENVLMQSD